MPKLDFSLLLSLPKPTISYDALTALSTSAHFASAKSLASIPTSTSFQSLAAIWAPEILKTSSVVSSLMAPSAGSVISALMAGLAPEIAKSQSIASSMMASSTGSIVESITASWCETVADINANFASSINWDAILRLPRLPDNWADVIDDKLEELIELVNVDGIPAAWVPRVEILEALLGAETGDARSEILIRHRSQILEDCVAILSGLDDTFLADEISIAEEVLESCRVGHWRVAALAAIPIVHSIVESLSWASDRQRVAHHHQLTMDMEYRRLTEMATRAPLVNFYDDWNPKSGKPRPVHLTRHVASHRLAADQVSARNCVVAVMLMTSLMMTVHQLKLGQRAVAA
jgi:hypothetical protein